MEGSLEIPKPKFLPEILFPCHLCCDLLTSLRIHFSQVLLDLFLIPD